MVKEPTGSGGEPSSPNFGVSAGVKARHLLFMPARSRAGLLPLQRSPGNARSCCRLISNGDIASMVVSALDSIIRAQKMKKVTV